MTYRDRRRARATRLREWAEKREHKAEAAFERADGIASMIPVGQPVLRNHHSEGRHRRDLDRIDRGMQQGVEHSRKAQTMRSKAANIEAAADRAIYSDDPDAFERLQERIAELEAERERIKAYNKSCRAGAPDRSLLSEDQQRDLMSALKHTPWACKGQAFPGYSLTNLSGTISRLRKRLVGLQT